MAKQQSQNSDKQSRSSEASSSPDESPTRKAGSPRRDSARQPAATGPPQEKQKKGGCGCCLAKLFALFLMVIMVAIIAAFVWRFVSHNHLQTKLAEYGAEGEVFGAKHLNTIYAPKENSSQATTLLSNACGDVSSSNFKNLCGALPYVGDGEVPRIGEQWDQLEAAKALVDQYQRAAGQLRQFGKLGGYAHFPIDFAIETGLDSESISLMKQGFNFLLLDSEIQMAEENAPVLADNIRAALVYKNAFNEIPSVDQYQGLRYDERSLRLLLRALSAVHFDKADLDSFNDLLGGTDYEESLRRMLSGSKVVGNQFFVDPGGYYETQLARQAVEDLPDALKNRQQAEMYLKYSPLAHEDHLAFLESIDEYEAILDMPWSEMVNGFSELRTKQDQRFNVKYAEYRYPFSPQLLPDFSDFVERVQKLATFRQMIYGALTVKRYEAHRTRIPTHLSDVTPDFSETPPADPYSDDPLIYRASKDTITIYSVGPNGKDDYGRNDDAGADDIRIVLPVNRFDGQSPSIIDVDID